MVMDMGTILRVKVYSSKKDGREYAELIRDTAKFSHGCVSASVSESEDYFVTRLKYNLDDEQSNFEKIIEECREYSHDFILEFEGEQTRGKKKAERIMLERGYKLSGVEFKNSYISFPGESVSDEDIIDLKHKDYSDIIWIQKRLSEGHYGGRGYVDLHYRDGLEPTDIQITSEMSKRGVKSLIDNLHKLSKKEQKRDAPKKGKKTVSRRVINKATPKIEKGKKRKCKQPRRITK